MAEHYPRLTQVLASLKSNADEAETLTDGAAGWLIGKHAKWDNLISGVALGYGLEASKALKYLKKQRPVDASRGDITTTSQRFGIDGQPRGKVVQLKHTLCATPGSVDTALARALKQLAGAGGEQPSTDDRLVAEIMISNPENSWPLTQGGGMLWVAQKYDYPLDLFEAALKEKLARYKKNGDFRPNIMRLVGDKTGEALVKKVKPSFLSDGNKDAIIEEIDTSQTLNEENMRAFLQLDEHTSFERTSRLLIKINYVGGRCFRMTEDRGCLISKLVCGVIRDPAQGLVCRILRTTGKHYSRLAQG